MLRRVLLLALVLLAVTPVALLLWLLLTESGLATIAGQLGRLERFGITIEGVHGTLEGPLRVERFELDRPGLRILATGIEADPRLRRILLQTVSLRWLRVQSVSVELLENDEPQAPTASAGPHGFLPAWLRIESDRVTVEAARFATPGGFELTTHRLAGRIELSRGTIAVEQFLVESDLFEAGGRVHLEAAEPLRIDVVASGRLTLEGRPPLELSAQLAGSPQHLELESIMSAPGAARAHAVIGHDDGGVRIEGTIEAPDPALSAWLAGAPVVPRDLDAGFTWTTDGFTLKGTVTVPEVQGAPFAFDVGGRYAARALEITRGHLTPTDGNTVVDVSGSVLFTGEKPQIDAELAWEDFTWPLAGEVVIASRRGRVALAGELPYRVTGSAILEAPGQPSAEVALVATLDAHRITLEALAVDGTPGHIDGGGWLEFDAPRRWSATLTGHRIDLSPWIAALPTQLEFTSELSGRGIDRDALGEARIASLGGTLRGLQVTGSGTVARDAHAWRVEQIDIRAGANRLRLDGKLGKVVDAHWFVDIESLTPLVEGAAGRLVFTGRASGAPDAARVDVNASGYDLAFAGWHAAAVSGVASLDLSDRQGSRLVLVGTGIASTDPLAQRIQIEAEGHASAHSIRIDADIEPLDPDKAPTRIALAAHGAYAERRWNLSLETLDIYANATEQIMSLESATQVAVATDRIDVEPICVRLDDGRLCARGSWQAAGPWSFNADADALSLKLLGDILPGRPDYSGQLGAHFEARGRAGTLLEGTGDVHVTDGIVTVEVVGGDTESLRLGSGRIDLTVDRETMHLKGRIAGLAKTFLDLQLTIARDLDRPFREQSIAGTIRARSEDTGVLEFLVPELDRVAGTFESDFAVFGTVGAPRLDGSVALRNAQVELYRFNTSLTDLNFTARLRDTSIVVDASGQMGEGQLDIGGTLTWHDGEPTGRFTLKGDKLTVADSPDLKVLASPDLEFAIDGHSINASGEVVIPMARIEPRDLRTASSVSSDARIVGAKGLPPEPEHTFDVRSRIRVALGDDVKLDAFGLSGRLEGSLTVLSGYRSVETGRGEIRVVDGKYDAYGQKLEIERGRLLFDGTPLADPGLDVQAQKELPDVTVGLNVRGTLRDPRLTLYSIPAMPQSQILSYLLIGKPIDEAGSSEIATVDAAKNSAALSGGGFLASQLGRRIGLEEVGIERSSDNNTSLVLGKFLSPRLFVSYGISLTESINTLKLRYTLSDSWVLKTEAGEIQSADLEFKIER
jgi:translocation and assembly module TamB